MFRRVKIRNAVSADDLAPLVVREFKSMFAVNGLPDVKFRGLGVGKRLMNEIETIGREKGC